jgi:ABC-type glycerol-3-phosphate transport system substrate-binding protein
MAKHRRIQGAPALLAILALLLPLIAACGGAAPATTAPTAGGQAQPTSAAPTGGEATAAPEAEPTPEGPQAQPTLVAAPNAVVLNYWDMQWGGPVFMNQLQDNVTEFNRTHPEIFVNFQQLSWGDYTQKFLSAIQAGNPPDIGGGDSGIPFNMDAQGQALDISDLYAEWEADGTFDDMVPWGYQKWDYNGKHPGITWQFDIRAIFYRKDLLEQAGIEVPTTWDELLAAAQKLTAPDKSMIGIAVPGKQGSYDTDQFYMTLVLQAGGSLTDENGNPAFDTPEQLAALEFEKQLVECCAAPGTPSWTFTEVLKAYEQGQAAMAFGGGWFAGDIKKNAPEIFENTGVLPVLIGPGGPEAQKSVAFANPWMIYKQTKHPEEAKIFLKWMMQKENLLKLYASDPGAKWPVYRSMLSDPIYQTDELVQTLAQQVVDHGVDYWYPYNKGAVGISSMGTGIADIIVNPVISGQRQPAEVLKDAQEQLGQVFVTQP